MISIEFILWDYNILCTMELKSYFSDVSDALVSVRAMFLQNLVSVRTI